MTKTFCDNCGNEATIDFHKEKQISNIRLHPSNIKVSVVVEVVGERFEDEETKKLRPADAN